MTIIQFNEDIINIFMRNFVTRVVDCVYNTSI